MLLSPITEPVGSFGPTSKGDGSLRFRGFWRAYQLFRSLCQVDADNSDIVDIWISVRD